MRNRLQRLTRVYKNLSIKKKLLLILYIQIIIPLVLMSYNSYKISSEILQRKSTDYSYDILKLVEVRLKDFAHNVTVASDFVYDKKIYKILKKDSYSDALGSYEDDSTILSELKRVVQSRDELQAILFAGAPGGRSYYFDRTGGSSKLEKVVPYRLLLDAAREKKGQVAWCVDSDSSGETNVYLTRVVYNDDTFTDELGLLVIMIDKKYLETVYQNLRNTKNIFIMTDKKQVIVSHSENMFSANYDYNGQKGYYLDIKSETLISYVNMKEPDWRIATFISLKDLNEEIVYMRNWIFTLSLISVLIVSILSLIMAVDLLKPINNLVRGMERVQKGESDVCIEVDRRDELGFLSKTFNKMAEELHHLVNWIYREQITRKEAEIKALQSQINPHFLFNTLESINWMAQLNNVPEISETVTDLSSIMEVGIGRDDKLITVEEEFNYTDKYISILKRRFEERIQLIKKVCDEVLKVRIPRLLIQPLIENAVYHGIEKSSNKGIINLNAYIVGQEVVIEVLDNGAGIDKEDLNILNEKLSMDNDTYFKSLSSKKSKSIGIENVNRRIKLFYGENYGLKIESEYGKWTKVIVRIPLQHDEKREGYYVQSSNS